MLLLTNALEGAADSQSLWWIAQNPDALEKLRGFSLHQTELQPRGYPA